jgi:hypothetical protein
MRLAATGVAAGFSVGAGATFAIEIDPDLAPAVP